MCAGHYVTSGGLCDYAELERSSQLESESFVELNGASVVTAHVQHRRLAATTDACHYLQHQGAGVAFAEMVGMRADGADLGKTRNVQTDSGHRDELPARIANADEIAELSGAHSKRPGLRKLS